MRQIDIDRMKMHGLDPKDFEPKQTDEERIKELEEQNSMLTECILELADIIYAE